LPVKRRKEKATNGRAMVLILGGCLGVILWASDAFGADPAVEPTNNVAERGSAPR